MPILLFSGRDIQSSGWIIQSTRVIQRWYGMVPIVAKYGDYENLIHLTL